MDVIQQPTFDPPYDPASDDNGGFRVDSILIQCATETTNTFTYNAWDGVARWFEILGPDGSMVFQGSMEVGQTVILQNVPGYLVRYFAGDVYEYGVVPGQCVESITTTTTPPTTTPPTTEQPTTSTTPPSTTVVEEPTTSTSSPSEEVEVEGTVTSLVPLPELNCEYFRTNNLPVPQEARYDSDGDGLYCETSAQTSRTDLAATGPVAFDPMTGVFLAAALMAGGLILKAVEADSTD